MTNFTLKTSIHPSIHPFIYLIINQFIHSSIHQSIHSSIYSFFHSILPPSIHTFIHVPPLILMLMFSGVTAIEPAWLALYAEHQCRFSAPLESPEPYYTGGDVYCYRTAKFGPHQWEIPASPCVYPQDCDKFRCDKFRWFAHFLLDGKVFPKLARFTSAMVVKPKTMISSYY